jgi:VanZ family protein
LIFRRTIAAAPPPVLARVIGWSLAAAIVVLSVVPATSRPETGLPHYFEHFAIFWATGLAFALGYSLTPLLATILVVFAGGVEILQLFIPGRHARLSDFIVDALASVIGLMTVLLVTQMRNRPRA